MNYDNLKKKRNIMNTIKQKFKKNNCSTKYFFEENYKPYAIIKLVGV